MPPKVAKEEGSSRIPVERGLTFLNLGEGEGALWDADAEQEFSAQLLERRSILEGASWSLGAGLFSQAPELSATIIVRF